MRRKKTKTSCFSNTLRVERSSCLLSMDMPSVRWSASVSAQYATRAAGRRHLQIFCCLRRVLPAEASVTSVIAVSSVVALAGPGRSATPNIMDSSAMSIAVIIPAMNEELGRL